MLRRTPYTGSHTPCDPLRFPIEGVRATYGESSLRSSFLFLYFFPSYMTDMPRDLTDSWRSVGRTCFFPLPFIFFPLFVESAMSRPLQTYESWLDRLSVCVCARACTRVFFASNARESTRRMTLCSRVITEMKAPGKTETSRPPRLRACRRPDGPDDYINQTTTTLFLTLESAMTGPTSRVSFSRIRSFAIKASFGPLKFGEM